MIIAGKYGSIAPDGTSFTEKEYDLAVDLRKPIMGFLYHDLNELKGAYLEEDPVRRTRLLAFREKVAARKMVRFYRNADELKTQVWHALTHTFRLKPGQGWVRAANASRIEDLRQITTLQQRTMELEAENASLRKASDAAAQLARGSDTAEFWVGVRSAVGGTTTDDEYRVYVTWDELLVASFERMFPTAPVRDVYHSIRVLIQEKVWTDSAGKWSLVTEDDNFTSLVGRVKRQLLGLSYIDVTTEGPELWRLTREGLVQLAILKGDTRNGRTPVVNGEGRVDSPVTPKRPHNAGQ